MDNLNRVQENLQRLNFVQSVFEHTQKKAAKVVEQSIEVDLKAKKLSILKKNLHNMTKLKKEMKFAFDTISTENKSLKQLESDSEKNLKMIQFDIDAKKEITAENQQLEMELKNLHGKTHLQGQEICDMEGKIESNEEGTEQVINVLADYDDIDTLIRKIANVEQSIQQLQEMKEETSPQNKTEQALDKYFDVSAVSSSQDVARKKYFGRFSDSSDESESK